MKKGLILIALLLVPFITNIISCGSSSVTSGKTAVTINLGPVTAGSAANSMKAPSAIPSGIVSVRFTISAPDMTTIQRTVSVEGRTSISETFDVPNGNDRYFLIEAMDSSGSILYKGDKYADLDGTPVTLTIGMNFVSFARTYGGMSSDYATSIQQTTDGGYIVAGYTDSFGAGGDDFWILKLDSNGSPQWQKAYGGAGSDYANSIQQTSDGGYIVAGYTYPTGAPADFWVLKLDSNGSPQWQKTYGGSNYDYAYSIQQTADGGHIVAGSTMKTFGDDAWILKLDSGGGIIWQKTYGKDIVTGDNDYAYSIQQTTDGGYIVAGETWSFGTGGDFWVLKLNSDGTVAWQKAYGGTGSDSANSIRQTSDGGYIVAGETWSFGTGGDFWVLKLNSDGTVAWQKTYGGTGSDTANSIHQTSDGGYIIGGGTNSFGVGLGNFWILRLNSDGVIAWQKTYGGTGGIEIGDTASSIQQITDGGYIVAGNTPSFGAGSSDFWVLKLASDGSINLNPTSGASTTDTTATVTDTTVTGADTTAIATDTTVTGADTTATVTGTNATITQQAP
jgi:uncharacterized delta-60 repeat protein